MERLTIQTKQIGTVRSVLLVIGTLLVFQTLISGFSKNTPRSKSAGLIEMDHCQLMLRVGDAINAGAGPMVPSESSASYAGKRDQLSNEACHQLERAAQEDPSASVFSKLIITSARLGKSTQAMLDRLSAVDSENAKELTPLLKVLYGQTYPAGLDVPAFRLKLEKNFPAGWYRNQALLKLYQISGNEAEYKELSEKLARDNTAFFVRLSSLVVLTFIGALLGCIVIVVQLFTFRNVSDHLDQVAAPYDYGWLTVYSVFIAWLATQILMGMLLQGFTGKLKIGVLDTMTMASAIAAIYLISNGPALLYIYLLALRPNKIKLLDGIKLSFKVGNLGVGGMVISGILAWLAAIPVSAVASIIAYNFLSAHGSSNPIMAVIMAAAHSANLSAMLLFYITLSVLAPVCEESLFRGFFYTFLRSRMSMLMAILVSASLFSLLHMDPGAMLPLFCLGAIFAFVFERTKSILPSIIAHGLWNGSTFALVLILFGN